MMMKAAIEALLARYNIIIISISWVKPLFFHDHHNFSHASIRDMEHEKASTVLLYPQYTLITINDHQP